MKLNFIDQFLNSITMYRLVLYGLFILAALSILFGFLNILPFSGFAFIETLAILLTTCVISNFLFSKLLRATTNNESNYITALILFFLLAPLASTQDILITIAAGIIAMASKYLLAVGKKHIFNPAAIAIFLLGLFGFGNAIWWVGSTVLLPFVAILGLLVVRKIRRFHLFFLYLAASLFSIMLFNSFNKVPLQNSFLMAFTSSPMIFLGTIMLTEPLTTPPRKKQYMMYGGLVGFLSGTQFHIGPLFSSPEFALIVGNIFSYLMSPKIKLFSMLREKHATGENMYEFSFTKDPQFSFLPGQYLEWTLSGVKPDSRGNRRYFTIASSPTESDLKLGVKVMPNACSAFKKRLLSLEKNDGIIGAQLSGDFVLPEDKNKKLVFIAGGIGVTPFRSIIKYLVDTGEKRDAILFYASANPAEFVYKDIFDNAEEKFGLKTIYVVTKADAVPNNWKGESGWITSEMIKKYVPDFSDRMYYLSGPNGMVEGYKSLLLSLKIPRNNIVTDYFPGF